MTLAETGDSLAAEAVDDGKSTQLIDAKNAFDDFDDFEVEEEMKNFVFLKDDELDDDFQNSVQPALKKARGQRRTVLTFQASPTLLEEPLVPPASHNVPRIASQDLTIEDFQPHTIVPIEKSCILSIELILFLYLGWPCRSSKKGTASTCLVFQSSLSPFDYQGTTWKRQDQPCEACRCSHAF